MSKFLSKNEVGVDCYPSSSDTEKAFFVVCYSKYVSSGVTNNKKVEWSKKRKVMENIFSNSFT